MGLYYSNRTYGTIYYSIPIYELESLIVKRSSIKLVRQFQITRYQRAVQNDRHLEPFRTSHLSFYPNPQLLI